jgi:hypothetical protein
MDSADFLPYGVSPLVNGSDVELLLLYWSIVEKKCRGLSGSLSCAAFGDASGSAEGYVADAYGDGVGDSRVSKKNARL